MGEGGGWSGRFILSPQPKIIRHILFHFHFSAGIIRPRGNETTLDLLPDLDLRFKAERCARNSCPYARRTPNPVYDNGILGI